MRTRVIGLGVCVVPAVLALSVALAPASFAATLCVNPAGTNGCYSTIQAAVNAAGSGDTIIVAGGTYAENLSAFGRNLTIDGAGAGATIISGNNAARVWTIYSNSTLNLANITIAYGSAAGDFGGGIYNDGTMKLSNAVVTGNKGGSGSGLTNLGTMTIDRSTVSNNIATGSGGGVVNGKDLTITNSTISGNTAAGDGGGIYHSGTVLTITNSTISGNTAAGNGGGIVNFSSNPVSITNSTISGNTAAGNGGGIVNGGTLTLASSTVNGNHGALGSNLYNSGQLSFQNTVVANGACTQLGTVISLGGNLDSGATCGFNPAQGDLVSTDPLLGPLADNGGPTFTHALLTDSPAINAGVNAGCPAADQRGVPRPQGAVCDIGAFELVDNTPPTLGACPAGGPFAYTSGPQPVGPIAAADAGSGVNRSTSKLSGSIDTATVDITSLTFVAADRVGNTASKTCQYAVTVYAAKQQILAQLAALRATAPSGKLDDAIKGLSNAIDPGLWLADGNHPQKKKVFDQTKDVAKKLTDLEKDGHNTIPVSTLQRIVDRLVGADRALASVAISDAVSKSGDMKKIAEARNHLTKGDSHAAGGRQQDAIAEYGAAWESAGKA